MDELRPEGATDAAGEGGSNTKEPECISLAWSADGQTLFAGYTDNLVRSPTLAFSSQVSANKADL